MKMHPYTYVRLEQCPDVADIKAEGRPTRVGRLDTRSVFRNARTKHAARRRPAASHGSTSSRGRARWPDVSRRLDWGALTATKGV